MLERRGLKDRAWAIEWESSALEFLLEKGFSPEMGARPLKRAIDQYVVAPLAAIIVEKRFPEGEQFLFVRSDGNGIQAEFVDPDAEPPADGEASAMVPSAAAPSSLASVVLTPGGSRAEFQMLQDEYADIERILHAAEWTGLKDNLAADMASAEFWTRPDRFGVLARFALMDRVKSATETANALRGRLQRYSRSPSALLDAAQRPSGAQLYLIREGIKDAFDDAPIELALTIEPVFEGAGDRLATLGWCQRLRSMYRAWAERRRMQVAENPGVAKRPGRADPDGQRLRRASHPGGGSGLARVRTIRRRRGPGHRARAPCRRSARRRTRRQGAQTGRQGARRGAAGQYGCAALPRGAAAGARRRRQMAERASRSRARRRLRSASGRRAIEHFPEKWAPVFRRKYDLASNARIGQTIQRHFRRRQSGKGRIGESEMRPKAPPQALHGAACDIGIQRNAQQQRQL